MNIIDYIFIGLIILSGLSGFTRGILKQVCGLVIMIISLAGGYLFYLKTENLIFLPIAIIVISIILKLITYVLRNIYFSLHREGPVLLVYSRITGAAIGLVKGLVMAFILILCMHLSMGFFNKVNPVISGYFEKSLSYSLLKQYDLLPYSMVFKDIYYAGELIKDNPGNLLKDDDEVIIKLKENSSFMAVLNDAGLKESIKNKDYKKVLSNPKFLNMINDKEVLDLICGIDYEALYKRHKKQLDAEKMQGEQSDEEQPGPGE